MTSLLTSLFRRAPQNPSHTIIPLPFTAATNPYRSQRPWPPDFTKLSLKHKFRLERRYRRRTKLKWARPGWKKFVTLAQWGSILFVVGYGVVYLDMGMGKGRTMVDEIRGWLGRQGEGFEGTERVRGEVREGKGEVQKG